MYTNEIPLLQTFITSNFNNTFRVEHNKKYNDIEHKTKILLMTQQMLSLLRIQMILKQDCILAKDPCPIPHDVFCT